MPGGPNVNHRLQLIAGRVEFYMSANTLQAFDAVAQVQPVGKAGQRIVQSSVLQRFRLRLALAEPANPRCELGIGNDADAEDVTQDAFLRAASALINPAAPQNSVTDTTV